MTDDLVARLRDALQHTQDKLHDAMMPDGLYAEDAARALRVVNAALAAPPATGKEG